ncbi:MAG: hypothetical protein HYU77_09055 [Betaproteobacteria bacterium]|nr:hypothetical protein [Betaproteobacteria bacterium]
MRKFAGAFLLASLACAAQAETPQEFTARLKQVRGVTATVNQREDGSFGSISIRIPPKVLSDRSTADELLPQVGRFAAEAKLKADVLTPTKEDGDYVVQKLKEAGVASVTAKVMAETVSRKDSRIFLIPEKREPAK